MTGDFHWVILSAIVVHRWLIGCALAPARVLVPLTVGLLLLTWFSTTTLANLAAVDMRMQLQKFELVAGIVLCIEAWLVVVFPRRDYLSPLSWAAILYLQARLFQSGYLSVPFEVQTLIFAGLIVSVLLLLRSLASTVPANYLVVHAIIIWLLCGVGLPSWPHIAGIDGSGYLNDTALLLAALPVALAVSVFSKFAWSKLHGALQGV